MAQPGLIEEIGQTLQMTGLEASHLKLEITESWFMDNLDSAVDLLQTLRQMGIQLGIDDFGTGEALGCEYGQGYHFSRPVDPPSASALIAA